MQLHQSQKFQKPKDLVDTTDPGEADEVRGFPISRHEQVEWYDGYEVDPEPTFKVNLRNVASVNDQFVVIVVKDS